MNSSATYALVATTPRLIEAQNSEAHISFRVAQGTSQEGITWYTITAKGDLAVRIRDVVEKGMRIDAEGLYESYEYQTNNGTTDTIEVIEANSLHVWLDGKPVPVTDVKVQVKEHSCNCVFCEK